MKQILRIVLAVLAIATLAACSGAAANPSGVASLGSASPDPESSGEPQASVDPEEAALAFAQCMREHGVDMPDPQVGSNGEMGFSIGGPGEGERPDFEQIQEAEESCADLMPGGLGEPREIPQEQKDAMLAFAQCMRDNGIDMPDPVFQNGSRVMIGGPGADGQGPAFDPQSGEFQAAQEACSHLLGEMRPGAGPGVTNGGPSGPSTDVQQ